MPLDLNRIQEPSVTKAKQLIEANQFSGLDDQSIKKLIWRHPQVFFAALNQKLFDLLLYGLRAGWSELTHQERARMPWLSAALEWGIQAEELYTNAHGLPTNHPLKNACLTAARQLDNWENQHGFWAKICTYSRPLDKLLGQPVPIGNDGWPINKLNNRGLDNPLEDIYTQATLFYHRTRPQISPSLQRQMAKLASEALSSGRLTFLQAT